MTEEKKWNNLKKPMNQQWMQKVSKVKKMMIINKKQKLHLLLSQRQKLPKKDTKDILKMPQLITILLLR